MTEINKTYLFITLGCKVNAYESAGMATILDNLGYRQVAEGDVPDVVVVNTCTVTAVSDKKSRQMIHRAIRNYPRAVICAVGCYSQLETDFVASIPGVHIVLGTRNRSKIGEYLQEYLKTGRQIVDVSDSLKNRVFDNLSVNNYHDNTRAFLKVQDGCNNFCTYCIVPYARGPMRSRDKNDILKEAQDLVNQGFKEIVLTGIHTAGYGIDLKDYDFGDLLKDIVTNVKGLRRLRISSIEESEISEKVINLLKESPIIVNHLHIPLQSGSEKILKLMGRKYTKEQFANTIARLREAKPDLAITTDVIVGFPGETDEDFAECEAFIKRIGFAQLHVFPYSVRRGTVAARMKDQIDASVKKKRVKELIRLSNELAKKYARSHENQVLPILFEVYDDISGTLEGHAPNYMRVIVKGDEKMLNTIENVKIITGGFPLSIGELED